MYDSCYMMTWTRWNGPCEVPLMHVNWTSLYGIESLSPYQTDSIHSNAKHSTAQTQHSTGLAAVQDTSTSWARAS